MKLLILCGVLSVILAVSFASPLKTQIREVVDSSDSSESSELKAIDNNSSSASEEEVREQVKVQKNKGKNHNEVETSISSSEERSDKGAIAKDEIIEISSSFEEEEEHPKEQNVVGDNDILDIKKLPGRSERSIEFAPHASNQLAAKHDDYTKYERYLKLKRLRRTLDTDTARVGRSADSSEENSSEEDKKGKKHAAQEHSGTPREKSAAAPAEVVVLDKTTTVTAAAETLGLAAKSDAAPADSEPKPEDATTSRRRRNIAVSSEEDQSKQEQSVNEVFIYSNEKQQDSEEDFRSNKQAVLNVNFLEASEKFLENKDSEEDYAQGCGGSNNNQDDDSYENSNENNETKIDQF